VHALAVRHVAVAPRLLRLAPPEPLAGWCSARGVQDAITGTFFTKPDLVPLGEHRIGGAPIQHRPYEPPWRDVRPALTLLDGRAAIAPRRELAACGGADLMQSGPLLVRDGRPALSAADEDPEGFSSQADLFDQDFTAGRLPRAAIALGPTRILAVVVDGRGPEDTGLTLAEFAVVLVELGATAAMNLDGGSSAALIAGGRMRNTPRSDTGEPLDGEPVPTAVVMPPRV
jgi:hypothetical protein